MARSMTWVVGLDHPDYEHINEAFKQLGKDDLPDRAVAIVGGALIEIYLTDTIKASLHQDPLTDTLFSPTGAIGNFGPKCDLAFLIGLVSKDAHRDLKTVVDIRNAFAHKLSVRDFKSDSPRNLARNLKLAERHTAESYHHGPPPPTPNEVFVFIQDRDKVLKDPRGRFLAEVQVLIHGFSRISGSRMPTPLF